MAEEKHLVEESVHQLHLMPTERIKARSKQVALSELEHIETPGRTLDAGMLESVRAFGVMNPIALVEEEDGTLNIEAGLKRLLHARAADLKKVPALIFQRADYFPGVIGLIENHHRSDNPLVDMRSIRDLLDEGASVIDIAQGLKISSATIKKRASLLGLLDPLMEAYEDGRMANSTAYDAAKLTEDEQEKLVEILEGLDEGARLTASHVKSVKQKIQQDAAGGMGQDLFEDFELPPMDPFVMARTLGDVLHEIIAAWYEKQGELAGEVALIERAERLLKELAR